MRIPVIPIPNMVFFPTTAVPLFVEDPGYVQMVEEAVAEEKPIGISLAQPIMTFDRNNFQRIQFKPCHICGMGTPSILNSYEDGSMKVLVQGCGRVQLHHAVQEIPYPIFEATPLYDRLEDARFAPGTISDLTEMLDQWIAINVQDSLEREAFQKSITSINHVLDYICMLMISDREIRQLLLEASSFIERVHMINTLLKTRRPLKEDQRTAQAIKYYEIIEKVSGNSH